MNMIRLRIQFDYFASKLLAETVDTIRYFLFYLLCQYPVTVLRRPNDVVLTVPYRV